MAVAGMPRQRELLRLATAGSVDDGKSTLIGRLLLDTGALMSDHLADVTGGREEPDLAAVTDGLRAEREQGITIDVAYRFFSSERRSFVLADTPGHERYTRNMFTGASTADVAVVLVDARHGVVRQTRRHMHISALLGIEHVVACVNKMDLVDWDQQRFGEIEAQVHDLARRLGVPDLLVVPISALRGDNVATASENTPFYSGPTLLEYLEQVDVQADRDIWHLRLPIQWVGRPSDGGSRLYTGRLLAGRLRPGDDVVVLPAGATTTIAEVDTLSGDASDGLPPLSVSFTLAGQLDVGRGDMLVAPEAQPTIARELDCTVCWMSDEPLHVGRRYALKHTTRTVRATVRAIVQRTDPETLETELAPTSLEINDIGQVTVRTSTPVLADPYETNHGTGSFILIDEDSNETVAAGVIGSARATEPRRGVRRDVTWHGSALDRDDRWLAIDQRGATVLLTGLSASGKSTIAVALERRLVESGQSAYLLDGDNIRHGLSEDLGFTASDRTEHIRRVGQVARLMADAGTVAVVSLISPLAADRDHMREAHRGANLPFVEVFVDTPIEECERRDPKGLYARARAGEITGFTGLDAPYEPPAQPELHINTTLTGVPEAVQQIVELLRSRPNVLAKGATMRISTKADYAVRGAIELAAAEDDGPIPAERIANSQGIPLNFLEHILGELRTAGLVRSRPGPTGGYELGRAAHEITVADVIRAVEGPLAAVRGARPEDAAYPGAAHQLPRVWIAVRKNLRDVVEHVSIADLAQDRLPESITHLSSDPEAWITRATARRLPDMPPMLSYVVCATPRSGSTLLCHLLDQTGIAGHPEEYFEALRHSGLPRRPHEYFDPDRHANIIERLAFREMPDGAPEPNPLWQPDTYDRYVDWAIRQGTTPNGVFGAKLMWGYLGDFAALLRGIDGMAGLPVPELLARVFPGLRYIQITRRDKVRQAISLWKAVQTQAWRQDGDTTRPMANEPQFSFRAINYLVRMLTAHDASWDAYFLGLGYEPLKITYEDLAEDPKPVLCSVLTHLGIPVPDDLTISAPRLQIQADALSERWNDRVQEHLEALESPDPDSAAHAAMQAVTSDGRAEVLSEQGR